MQMAATKVWTLEELHSLPDDGNKYELINGELYVTPAPTPGHESIAVRLARLLETYVVEERLGFVYRPRAVFRWRGSEVEPDLMVRAMQDDENAPWETHPFPILVVEIGSPSTARRDRTVKRDHYRDAEIAEYWIVDRETLSITRVRPNASDVTEKESVTWHPAGASRPLTFAVAKVFGA